jgi:hypothetical protein
MTSKRFSGRAVRRGNRQAADGVESGRSTMIFDITLNRIEAFNRANGGGVSVRKMASGYTLIREDTGEPVARLRSRDGGCQYEVLRRSEAGERWRPVGVAGLVLPLDEALAFVAEDPLGCFWE